MIAELLSYTAIAAAGAIYSAWLCRNRLRDHRKRIQKLEQQVQNQ